ncbi:MAG: aminoacyl--tRNA ligase-related protein, partial [Candidatus Wolfebacteria bacterium]|nr:aminoacyl--tRNA ligase-related protein [Candidatus Wolfebacteria bacterium]
EKNPPKDEESLNALLLERGGFIQRLMSGVYSYLPLGLLVLKKIEQIIREEMNTVGGQEILMPALHPLENYIKTGRENISDLFHTALGNGSKFVLGQSHEEVVVPLVQRFAHSYKDLPLAVYQIQTKFRNELRAKSGLFRGREFPMKDMYSFHLTEEDFEKYYDVVKKAYIKIFERAGIGGKTYFTYAAGGTFSKFSHEFQMLTPAGEDTIYTCEKCRIAVNDEIKNAHKNCPECGGVLSEPKKAIEVGNIFPLKTKFSDAFGMKVKNEEGKEVPVFMGCYGIGLSRLMGAVAEVCNDQNGLIWPESVAPFSVHLVYLKSDDKNIRAEADKLYEKLTTEGTPVLYDDREDKSAGEKFAESDIIGIPLRVVLSEKTLKIDSVELKKRGEKDFKLVKISEIKKYVK